jgi:hypothetical protein
MIGVKDKRRRTKDKGQKTKDKRQRTKDRMYTLVAPIRWTREVLKEVSKSPLRIKDTSSLYEVGRTKDKKIQQTQ